MSEFLFNVKSIIKKLKEILICDRCQCLFDCNIHLPLIIKTGETFCKKCLIDNIDNPNKDNIFNLNNLENNTSFKFVENLKIKTILKEIINLYDKANNEKYVSFSKQLTDRNNNQRFGHYLLTYNINSSPGLKENSSSDCVYNNSNKNVNDQKKSLNNSKTMSNNDFLNNINNININKNDKKEIDEKIKNNDNENKPRIITKEIVLKNTKNNIKSLNLNNINNIKNVNFSDLDENLNTITFNDEININRSNKLFESKNSDMKKIDDDSIETIPINDEKSTVNMSFKNEFNELWSKNDDQNGEFITQNEIRNDLNKYVFINKNNLIKNNKKCHGSCLNIKKKNDNNYKDILNEKENKFIYQFSEPNFETINKNKLNNNNNYELEKEKNNNRKEEEKSANIKIYENQIKKIFKNSSNYDLNDRNIFKTIENNDNNINNNAPRNIKEYYKINANKNQVCPRQTIKKEIRKKIIEDNENNIKFKNLTTIKDNNIKKYKDKNILFDEDQIKIVVKNINNIYDKEGDEDEKKLLINIINDNDNDNDNDDKNEIPRHTVQGSKIKNTITYNRKILGKTNLSPIKNKSIEKKLISKNINKFENFKQINNSINKIKFRTISHAKTNGNLNTNNLSTNDVIGFSNSGNNDIGYINNSNQNNINSNKKITSIYLKLDNQKQHIINNFSNSNNSSNYQNNSHSNNNSNSDNYDYESIKNEDKIKYITDEKINTIKQAKTFMNKTKDELDNLYVGSNLNMKIRNNDNNNIISKNNFLEIKMKEFNNIFKQKTTKEKNISIKNHLLKNKKKYEEIIKKSINSPLLNNLLNEIKILFLSNNDFYIGILSSQNLPEKGFLYSLDGNYYEGMFLNGKKEGKGLIIYKNGAKYEGDLKNNLHNGVGKLTQLDGEIFIGEWKDGKINGNGVRYHSNGDVYSGHYINSIRDGTGKYIFSNGDSYEGKWKNGKANGKGIYKFKNGNIYEGNFENNNFCGQGCFKKKKGDIYIGEFKNGVLNGEGTIINKNEEKFVGMFKNGKKYGKGTIYDKDGNIIKSGTWEDNELVSEESID